MASQDDLFLLISCISKGSFRLKKDLYEQLCTKDIEEKKQTPFLVGPVILESRAV
jgi:hypothetical protein